MVRLAAAASRRSVKPLSAGLLGVSLRLTGVFHNNFLSGEIRLSSITRRIPEYFLFATDEWFLGTIPVMAWYRKHRPQTVAGLALAPIRKQLQAVLDTGTFAHAYLFAGPKGTGKTSSARILARILNDARNQKKLAAGKGPLLEPAADDPLLRRIASGDAQVVLEIDAASHRGIDDVRALQEQVSVAPSEGWYRVVILDEVHMMTNEAFNALLKLLEEPPSHVVFILATTELQKVPATIQSRCSLVRFRQAKDDEVGRVLADIAQAEGVTLSEAAAERIAAAAEGSFRDAVKYFELIVRNGKVDEAALENILGSQESVTQLLRSLAQVNLMAVSEQLVQLREQGVNFVSLEQSLVKLLQQRLHRAIARHEATASIQRMASLLEHLVRRSSTTDPVEGISFELACLSWCLDAASTNGSDPGPTPQSKTRAGSDPSSTIAERVRPRSDPSSQQACDRDEEAPTVVSQPVMPADGHPIDAPSLLHIQRSWPEFLLALRIKSQALESIVRGMSVTSVDGTAIHVQTSLAFHKEQLQKPKYATAIHEALTQVFGRQLTLVVDVHQSPALTTPSADTHEDQLLAAVEAAVLSLG